MNRSKKAFRNVFSGLFNKMVLLLLAFFTRTIFIRLLGAEYTGVNSLYTNILSVLSLAELGVGNVLMFHLYSAIKEKNEKKICSLVYEFKKIYNTIVLCILIIGLLLIPFLKYIINTNLNNYELIIYYVIYLLNSVVSYLFIYRTMVISADQNNYITNICSTITTIIMYIMQISYLIVFKNFLGYLLIQLFCTLLNNVVLNIISIKEYPYLRKINEDKEEKINKKDLFINIKATFIYKVSETILDQTDSIIISMLFGTVFVGYYSNYYIIMVYLSNISAIIANGLVAGFGDLNAERNKEKSYLMFKVAMLIFSIFGTFCTTCYISIIQDFIPIWIGINFVMGYDIVISIMAVFYLRMVTNSVWMYRSTMGLFKEVQYINLIAAILNIILSVILGKIFGISGVILATAISRLLTSFWYEGKILFKTFEVNVWTYYIQQFKDFCVMIFIVVISLLVSNYCKFSNITNIILKIIICTIITSFIEFMVNKNREEFIIIKVKIIDMLKRKGD